MSLFLLIPGGALQAAPPGNASFATSFWYDDAYNDQTAAAEQGGAPNDTILGSTIANQSSLWGMDVPFSKLHFAVGNWGLGNGKMEYLYSSAAGFKTLTINPSDNPTNDFKVPNNLGVATLQFTPPADWTRTTINGVTRYWFAMVTKTAYSNTPKASYVLGTIFNLKVKLQTESGAAWTDNFAPQLSNCGNNDYFGEWNAVAGIHWYGLRTDGGSCTVSFKGPGWFGSSFTTTYLTSLKDFSDTPITLKPSLKVTVKDDAGSSVTDASVTYLGLSLTPNAGSYSAAIAAVSEGWPLSIARNGYVTEDGSALSGNTGLAKVQVTDVAQTNIVLDGSQSCINPIVGKSAACAALRRDMVVTVKGGNNNLLGALVTFYNDQALSVVADDVTVGQSGLNDALGYSDGSGVLKTALSTGTYYYKVSASGYVTTTGAFGVTSGSLNTLTVSLTATNNPPADTNPSASQTTVTISPTSIVANGVQTGTVTVTVKNAASQVLSGKTVSLVTPGVGTVTVVPSQVTSDANGVAQFTIKSMTAGTVTIAAYVNGSVISQQPSVQFTVVNPNNVCSYIVGSLYKLPNDGNAATQEDSAVYYYGADCKRHAFPNDKVYFTWYSNFDGVTTISLQTMANMMLGKNVTYRPGVKMVKFTTVPKVYAISKGGVLRWVGTENVAINLYGATWNKKIDDISDAFYVNYQFGSDILVSGDYNAANEMANTLTPDANF